MPSCVHPRGQPQFCRIFTMGVGGEKFCCCAAGSDSEAKELACASGVAVLFSSPLAVPFEVG